MLAKGDDREFVFPKRVNLASGETHFFTLSEIQTSYPGVSLPGSIELKKVIEQAEAYLHHNVVPVQFTEEDIEHCISKNSVIKVIYVPNPTQAGEAFGTPEVIVSTRLDPGLDPIAEAERRGTVMAVIRLCADVTD